VNSKHIGLLEQTHGQVKGEPLFFTMTATRWPLYFESAKNNASIIKIPLAMTIYVIESMTL
jgi:hypothetical protein